MTEREYNEKPIDFKSYLRKYSLGVENSKGFISYYTNKLHEHVEIHKNGLEDINTFLKYHYAHKLALLHLESFILGYNTSIILNHDADKLLFLLQHHEYPVNNINELNDLMQETHDISYAHHAADVFISTELCYEKVLDFESYRYTKLKSQLPAYEFITERKPELKFLLKTVESLGLHQNKELEAYMKSQNLPKFYI